MKKIIIFIVFLIILGIIYNAFYPIPFITRCKEDKLYRYQFGIYAFDTLSHSIYMKKVGDFKEYIGWKSIKCTEEIEHERAKDLAQIYNEQNKQMRWKELSCALWYSSKNNVLGFKTEKVISLDNWTTTDFYITEIEDKPLIQIVDTASFVSLGAEFYKDKNHIYEYYAMSGGGFFRFFRQADYASFEVLNDCYAKDARNIYTYRNGKIDADYKTFITSTKDSINPCLAKDKYGYLWQGERLVHNDLKDSITQEQIRRFEQIINTH